MKKLKNKDYAYNSSRPSKNASSYNFSNKYLPMVITDLNLDNFGWTREHREIDSYLRALFDDNNCVLLDPKSNWFLDYGYSETAMWKDSAKHEPKLLAENSGLGQDKTYAEILQNIEKLKGQVR